MEKRCWGNTVDYTCTILVKCISEYSSVKKNAIEFVFPLLFVNMLANHIGLCVYLKQIYFLSLHFLDSGDPDLYLVTATLFLSIL